MSDFGGKMKRKLLITILLIISFACLTFSSACFLKREGEEVEVIKPTLTDIQVDVTDAPSAFSIGTYELQSVKVNGNEFSTNKYTAKNGYFVFLIEYYGELGIGENIVEITFKEGTEQFKVSVSDSKSAIYTLPSEDVLYGTATGAFVLPKAEKTIPYQQFDINYELKDKSGDSIKTLTNPTTSDLVIDLDKGFYTLDIDVVKNQESIDSWQGEIYINGSENLLSEENISKLEYDKAGLELSFDASFNGLKVFKKTGQYGIESRIGIDYEVIKDALDKGDAYLFFRYYSENGFFFDSDGNRYLDLSLGYFSEQTGSGNVGSVADVKVNPDEGTNGSWQNALIPLTANENAKYLNFLVFACANEYFNLRDMYILDASDAIMSEQYELIVDKEIKIFVGQNVTLNVQLKNLSGNDYSGDPDFKFESSDSSIVSVNDNGVLTANGVGSANVTVTAIDGKYSAVCNVSVSDIAQINYASLETFNRTTSFGITMEYVENEQAIKMTKIGANISGNHSHIDMPILDELRFAKSLGKAMLSFEYKAENIYGSGANNPVLWVMATDGKVETIGSACWVTNAINITLDDEGVWNKGVVKLDNEVLNNEDYDYLVFLVGGEVDGTLMLKNIKFGTQSEYDEYVQSIQILSLEGSVNLFVGEDKALSYLLTNIDGSAYAGDAKYSWVSSNSDIVEVDTNGNILAKAEGDATITLAALDGKYTATCRVTVNPVPETDYTTVNYAAPTYYGSWVNYGISMEYVDADQAIKLTKLGANISGSHSHIEIAIMDEIRLAKVAGMKMLTFEYYASGLYGSGTNNPIIWIMANDGTPNGVSSSYHIATPIDITADSEDKWMTAYVPLQDIYWLYLDNINNEDLDYFMILVGGEQGGTISIKNINFGDDIAYEKYNYSIKNFASPTFVSVTDANSIGLEYDTTENAMKITKLYAGLSGSHSHVRMPIMDEIRRAKELGFSKLTLEYKANEGDLLWIMCNDGSDSSVGSGCWLTSGITVDGTLAGKWNKVEIDLSNSLIDVETNEYLMFLSGGSETGGSIYIRNICLA